MQKKALSPASAVAAVSTFITKMEIAMATAVTAELDLIGRRMTMKKVTLEKVLNVLKTGENEVFVDDALREESKKPLERMLELAK